MISKLAIIGPGLLGGSLMYAVRERSPQTQIAVWARREEAVEEIKHLAIADLASSRLDVVVCDADFIVLCVPIGAMPKLAEEIAPLVSAETIITDVGSVKAPVVEALDGIFRKRARFVGSHPMAGSEMTGLAAARADLFQDSISIVTPTAETPAADVEAVKNFWTAVGCHVRTLSPREHDEVIALVSHLPHLVAASLVQVVSSVRSDAMEFCGNGFRDTTRVASGSPAMWQEIFAGNRMALKTAAEAMIEKLQHAVRLLEKSDDSEMTKFLTEAKKQRDRLKPSK